MYKLLPCYKTHSKCWKPETKIGSGIPIASEPSPARLHFVLVKLILIFNEMERGAATLKAINLVSRWIRNIQRMMRKKSAISPPFFTHCNYWIKFDKLLLLNYGDFCTIIIVDTIVILSWNIEVIPVISIKHRTSKLILKRLYPRDDTQCLVMWCQSPRYKHKMWLCDIDWCRVVQLLLWAPAHPACRRCCSAACDLLIHHG